MHQDVTANQTFYGYKVKAQRQPLPFLYNIWKLDKQKPHKLCYRQLMKLEDTGHTSLHLSVTFDHKYVH
jgi:hypothetical protein